VYLTGVGRRQPQSGSAENSIPRSGNATALKQFFKRTPDEYSTVPQHCGTTSNRISKCSSIVPTVQGTLLIYPSNFKLLSC